VKPHAGAAGAFAEGLAVIAPFVERHVHAFGDLAGALRQEYIAACKKAGIALDAMLLERVARAWIWREWDLRPNSTED
jgi:hypothetical protein